MTVDDYALNLLHECAVAGAEDDLDECGDLDDDDDGTQLRAAIKLSIEMAHAIRDNPVSFRQWYRTLSA